MKTFAMLGWMLLAFCVAPFAAAFLVGMYLNALHWIAVRKVRSARRLLEIVESSVLVKDEVPLRSAVRVLVDACRAQERYEAACRRWGLEP